LKQLGAIDDFDEGSALAVGCGYPDGGGVLDADALAECVVSLDGGGEFALGIECEGELDVVVLCVVLSELAEDVEEVMEGWLAKTESR